MIYAVLPWLVRCNLHFVGTKTIIQSNLPKLCGLLHIHPNLPIFVHRYICHICDILQLCTAHVSQILQLNYVFPHVRAYPLPSLVASTIYKYSAWLVLKVCPIFLVLVKLEVMGIVVSLSNCCQPDEGNSDATISQKGKDALKEHNKICPINQHYIWEWNLRNRVI